MSKIDRLNSIRHEFGTANAIKLAIANYTHQDQRFIDTACSILYRDLSDRVSRIDEGKEEKIKEPVFWSFWWQGVDSLPEVLKIAYESHKRHISNLGYKYIFVDQNNLEQYIDVPPIIKKKLDEGIISFTHFSDYTRIALLEQYGGAWIDITLLMVDDIPKDLFNYQLYSLSISSTDHIPVGLGQKITECRWAGFMFSTNEAHNPLLRYIKDSLEDYWKLHDVVLDYFLMNLIIRTAYINSTYVRTLIDSIPRNNPHLYDLATVINTKFDENVLDRLEQSEVFFKVTQKVQMVDEIEGKPTFYSHYKEKYLR